MENYEVMIPEKEAEVFDYVADMIRGGFDRVQFATAEQKSVKTAILRMRVIPVRRCGIFLRHADWIWMQS